MINVMFWNIDGKPNFERVICDVLRNENIDILLLAEASNVDDNQIEANSILRRISSPIQADQIGLTPRFYSNNRGFRLSHYHTVQNTKRLVLCNLEIPGEPIILLTGIHFPSKLEYDNTTQGDIANSYINWLNNAEGINKRTIVFGDFNMNPFEEGLINSSGLHNTNNKEIALTKQRNFQGNSYDFFYNPMWNFFGDSSKGKAQGTHF